jgi:hypothetical protein
VRIGSLLASITLAGCTRTEPGTCYRERDNVCVEFVAAQAAAGKRMCANAKWTSGAPSCPTAEALGGCTKKDGVEYLYGGPPNNYTAASARSVCEAQGGTFTP